MDQKPAATTVPKLTTFYIKDAKSNRIKLVQATTGKPFRVKNMDNQEQLCYVSTTNLDTLAKEASVVDTRRELGNLQIQTNYTPGMPHVVTVPIVNTGVAPKMSPFKVETSILPKQTHPGSSPMILSPPQRGMNVASSPRTPQTQASQAAAPSADQANAAWQNKRINDYREMEYVDSGHSGKRSRKGEKGKGLRHFSMKVCEKVQKKGVTSYNEVADELVAEFSDPQRSMSPTDQAYDQKNIRRRVYDALNVLMAMNIISKEKKEIRWLGLPTNSAQECSRLEHEKHKRAERIRMKTQQLNELILQQIAYKNLVQRNKQNEKTQGSPSPNSTIHLPFIVINTSKNTIIDCSISNDKMEYLFNFDNTFEIHDDIEVMKRMGMTFSLEKGQCRPEDVERAKEMVPKALQDYVALMSKGAARLARNSSIVSGPSGIQAQGSGDGGGSSSSGIAGSDDMDLILLGAAETSSVSGAGVRRLSRQSSVASGSDHVLSSRHDAPTSDEDDDFSGTDSEDDPALMDDDDDSVAMAE